MQIAVLFPGINQNGSIITHRQGFIFHDEMLVRATGLQDDMAMVMGVRNQRGVHVEKGNSTKIPAQYSQGRRHTAPILDKTLDSLEPPLVDRGPPSGTLAGKIILSDKF
jgi:hypothetical protein